MCEMFCIYSAKNCGHLHCMFSMLLMLTQTDKKAGLHYCSQPRCSEKTYVFCINMELMMDEVVLLNLFVKECMFHLKSFFCRKF